MLPGKLTEVDFVDSGDLKTKKVLFKPRDRQDVLVAETLGTLGLARAYSGAFTEESLSALTGMKLDDLNTLSKGFIPWARDGKCAWQEKAIELGRFLAGDDPGLMNMVSELGFK